MFSQPSSAIAGWRKRASLLSKYLIKYARLLKLETAVELGKLFILCPLSFSWQWLQAFHYPIEDSSLFVEDCRGCNAHKVIGPVSLNTLRGHSLLGGSEHDWVIRNLRVRGATGYPVAPDGVRAWWFGICGVVPTSDLAFPHWASCKPFTRRGKRE